MIQELDAANTDRAQVRKALRETNARLWDMQWDLAGANQRVRQLEEGNGLLVGERDAANARANAAEEKATVNFNELQTALDELDRLKARVAAPSRTEAEHALLDAMAKADIYETFDGRAAFASIYDERDACRAELARREPK